MLPANVSSKNHHQRLPIWRKEKEKLKRYILGAFYDFLVWYIHDAFSGLVGHETLRWMVYCYKGSYVDIQYRGGFHAGEGQWWHCHWTYLSYCKWHCLKLVFWKENFPLRHTNVQQKNPGLSLSWVLETLTLTLPEVHHCHRGWCAYLCLCYFCCSERNRSSYPSVSTTASLTLNEHNGLPSKPQLDSPSPFCGQCIR